VRVIAQAAVDIAAPQREVWAVLADIDAWPTWNPAVRYAVCETELQLEVGTRFRFSTELGTLKCRITRVDAPRILAWKARVLLLGERVTWRLEPTEQGTHVEVEAQMTGPVSRLFRRRLDARLQRVMDSLVRLLRLEAEARTADKQAEAARAAASEEVTTDG
jgi:uncharacterized protein YndB with AHSA1/START domain